MRAVVQRVTRATVEASAPGSGDTPSVVGSIGPGLLVLLGVTHDDTPDVARRLATKIHGLRILRGERSVAETGDGILVVSQFTLYGDARKGRRPTWTAAAPGQVAQPLYDAFCSTLRSLGADVAEGVFGADMAITMTADGPTTLVLEM